MVSILRISSSGILILSSFSSSKSSSTFPKLSWASSVRLVSSVRWVLNRLAMIFLIVSSMFLP